MVVNSSVDNVRTGGVQVVVVMVIGGRTSRQASAVLIVRGPDQKSEAMYIVQLS